MIYILIGTKVKFHVIPFSLIVIVLTGCGAANSQTSVHANHDQAESSVLSTYQEHHNENVSITLNTKEVKANEKFDLAATITNNKIPVEDGISRLEIWENDDEKHQFIQLAPYPIKGVYGIKLSFKKNTKYHVRVHIETDEIHAHEDFEIIVN